MGFRPRKTYMQVLTSLGLTSGLKLCLDAGDSASLSSPQTQTWADRSGQGNDFLLGSTSSSESVDPSLVSDPGGKLTPADSLLISTKGQYLLPSSGSTPTFITTQHQAGAKFSYFVWWYAKFLDGAGSTSAIFGNVGSTGTNGVSLSQSPSRDSALCFDVFKSVGTRVNGAGGLGFQVSGYKIDGWNAYGIAVDEAGGASASRTYLNGAVTTFDGAYTSPSAGAPASTFAIGATSEAVTSTLLGGSRLALIAAWDGVALTASQFAQIEAADVQESFTTVLSNN